MKHEIEIGRHFRGHPHFIIFKSWDLCKKYVDKINKSVVLYLYALLAEIGYCKAPGKQIYFYNLVDDGYKKKC